MNPTKIKSFSATYEDYERVAERYILTLNDIDSKEMQYIEKSLRMFVLDTYGYLPAAGEIEWPVLKPNYDANVVRLVPFHEAYSYGITDAVVHFYIADRLFMRLFRNPEKYVPFLKTCYGVIGTDVSQYVDMPAEMRYRHAWCNTLMSAFLQNEGVNLYPNITWSKKDSFCYSFPTVVANSVVAINSNAIHCSDLAMYRWKSGYKNACETLSPLHIIRYGQPVDGEYTSISSYFVNERLNRLRNGRKRKQ